jgi:hypothetical protein
MKAVLGLLLIAAASCTGASALDIYHGSVMPDNWVDGTDPVPQPSSIDGSMVMTVISDRQQADVQNHQMYSPAPVDVTQWEPHTTLFISDDGRFGVGLNGDNGRILDAGTLTNVTSKFAMSGNWEEWWFSLTTETGETYQLTSHDYVGDIYRRYYCSKWPGIELHVSARPWVQR